MNTKLFYNSDSLIVEGIKKSDDKALKFVYKKYYIMIHQFVVTNTGLKQDADDLFQDGIIILYEKIKNGSYKGNSSIKTYFYSICRNQWLKVLRKRRIFVPINDQNKYIDIPDDNLGPEYDDSTETAILKEQLSILDQRCRQIIVFFFYEKLSLKQIAKKLGYTNAENAKTQKYRCIQKLKMMCLSE